MTPLPPERPLPADAPADAPPRRREKKPPRAGLVGPLFRWELVRLARRGQGAHARFLLAAGVLLVLTVFTLAWFPRTNPRELFFGTSQLLSLQDSSRFGNQFALSFLLGQLGVLILLTPAYAAGGIAEEKEKKTFVFLLVSDLTSREIVFGKFLGRLVFLLGVMFAGLPILAITLVYGGVSLKFLLMGYLITGTTVTLLAGVSAAAACATDTFRGALFRGYGLTALHVLVGCGFHPVLSPFGIITFLSWWEAETETGFLVVGFGYAASQVLVAVISVWMAVRWVRKMRSRPHGRAPRRGGPGRRDGDRRGWEPRTLRRPKGSTGVAAEDLVPVDPAAVNGEPVQAAKPIPAAVPVSPPPPPRARRRHEEPRLPTEVRNRPKVFADDPFLWKELYTTGAKQTADDDSIKGVMLAVGITVGITVAFFALISLLTLLASGGSGRASEVAERLLLLGGTGGFFTYLLVVGSGAAGAVVRERQRQTLESLLTIPIDRRAILWPKWVVSGRKGWWWGLPASLTVPLGLLVSDVPSAGLAALLFVAAGVPLAASYGLWLSIRCRTATRAILWFLPVAGVLTITPIAIWSQIGPESGRWPTAVVAALAAVAGIGGWLFWQLAVSAFAHEGRG